MECLRAGLVLQVTQLLGVIFEDVMNPESETLAQGRSRIKRLAMISLVSPFSVKRRMLIVVSLSSCRSEESALFKIDRR